MAIRELFPKQKSIDLPILCLCTPSTLWFPFTLYLLILLDTNLHLSRDVIYFFFKFKKYFFEGWLFTPPFLLMYKLSVLPFLVSTTRQLTRTEKLIDGKFYVSHFRVKKNSLSIYYLSSGCAFFLMVIYGHLSSSNRVSSNIRIIFIILLEWRQVVGSNGFILQGSLPYNYMSTH